VAFSRHRKHGAYVTVQAVRTVVRTQIRLLTYLINETANIFVNWPLTCAVNCHWHRVTGDQPGRMGGDHVLRTGHSFVLGLDLLRSSYCREWFTS